MIDPYSPVAAYRQLAALLRDDIASGALAAGERVPSAKTLSQEHGIAVGTVMRALNLLRDEGLIVAVPGRGYYVVPEAGRG
jgi:DNA-binding GntR family transcriptional regulator